jgi:hypothetical protein
MKSLRSVHESDLSVPDLAAFFKGTAQEILSGSLIRRISNTALSHKTDSKFEFFTPTSNSPFAEFEQQPDFSVGVVMPAGGLSGGALPVTIHMYVLDTGPRRRVEFVAPYDRVTTAKRKAARQLENFSEALHRVDPAASAA